MSSIGGVGSLSTSQFAQQAQRRAGGPNGKDFAERAKAAFTSAAEQAGVSADDASELATEIQSAIDDAKSKGTSPGSIKDIVHGVLEEHGVDVKAFDAALDAQHSKGAHRGHRHKEAEGSSDDTGGDFQVKLAAQQEQEATGKGQLVDTTA